MNPVPHWTKRAHIRLRDAFLYIATNFYPEYAVAFENDVLSTTETIPHNPEIGTRALCLPPVCIHEARIPSLD